MDEPFGAEQAEREGIIETPAEAGEAAETAERAEDPGAATEDIAKDMETPVGVCAKTEFAVVPGGKPVYDGAAGGEEPVQGGAAAGREDPTQGGAVTGEEDSAQGGAAAGEEATQDRAVAGWAEPAAAGKAGETEAEWRRRAEGYALRTVFSEARAAAAAMGVPENRLDHVARLSDLSGIGPEDGGTRGKIAQAVQRVLRELPELRGGVGTGQATAARRPRRDAFERGFLGD